MTNQQLKNIPYDTVEIEKIHLHLYELRNLECLADLHDTMMFYLAISLLIAVWVILCSIRHYLVYKSDGMSTNDENEENWVLMIIMLSGLIFGVLCTPNIVYCTDNTTDVSKIYPDENQWYWHSYDNISEFDFSVSANNYHITNFEKVEELAMEIRQLDKNKISITNEVNYTQDHTFSCLSTLHLEVSEIIDSNPAFDVTWFPADRPFTSFLEMDYRDDNKIIETASIIHEYIASRIDAIKCDTSITEGNIEDISMAEQGLNMIRDEIDELIDLNDKLNTCDYQLATKYYEWDSIKGTLSYPDPYSFVYDPINETSGDYFRDDYSDYQTHSSEMVFSENNLSENWDQLPFHNLSSEQVEKTIKTKADVWVDYQDMGKTMQAMFESSY